MPKVFRESPLKAWGMVVTLVVGLCGLLSYAFAARNYVDTKVEKLEAKAATKESVNDLKDRMIDVQNKVNIIYMRMPSPTPVYGPLH